MVTTGFNPLNLPNMDWMLRILVWADEDMKLEIFDRMTLNKKAQ